MAGTFQDKVENQESRETAERMSQDKQRRAEKTTINSRLSLTAEKCRSKRRAATGT